MITCDIGGIRFNYRAAGVCIEEEQVLLYTIAGLDFWFLPGGRVEAGESAEQSLLREMEEELGLKGTVGRLLWVVENFFLAGQQRFHELGFYYEIALPSGSSYHDRNSVYHSRTEAGDEATLRWFPLAALGQINLLPAFLKEELRHLPPCPHHLVVGD